MLNIFHYCCIHHRFVLELLTLLYFNYKHGTTMVTRRIAIANGTCVSLCNQPKAQFGYLGRVTPVCRCLRLFCGWRHLVTSRESKAHFGLPWQWVRPWDNRSKCYMGGKRIQCWSNALQHISIYLQLFTSYSDILSEIATFSYPLHLTPLFGVFPLEFLENVWTSEN